MGDNVISVTSAMREAGAAVLSAPELSYTYEDMAEAVFIAMALEARRDIKSRPLVRKKQNSA